MYVSSMELLAALLVVAFLGRRSAWALPLTAVLVTIGAWYFIEPLYLDSFEKFTDQEVESAYGCVFVFLLTLTAATPLTVQWLIPLKAIGARGWTAEVRFPATAVLYLALLTWLTLLTYGVVRMEGDVVGALFPMAGRSGATMWSRAAGADAGPTGFLVSAASYVYVLCIAVFGGLLFVVKDGKHRALLVCLICASWPYVFMQGSRNLILAVVGPCVLSYALFSRQNMAVKGSLVTGAAMVLELALRVVIQYRNIGFGSVSAEGVEDTKHAGLNMASELVYCVQFISNGTLDVARGARYLAEAANAVPRFLWANKPLIGIDYAIARGFGGGMADIGVYATVSTGVIGQGVLNFGLLLGPIAAAVLMAIWVGILTRLRLQGTTMRTMLFLVGLGVTFNLGRDITLLVLWPVVFGYIGIRLVEWSIHYKWRSERGNQGALAFQRRTGLGG